MIKLAHCWHYGHHPSATKTEQIYFRNVGGRIDVIGFTRATDENANIICEKSGRLKIIKILYIFR